ncbi:MAG: hypothetical protein Kow0077_13510 [Anaerolineae bacterium]
MTDFVSAISALVADLPPDRQQQVYEYVQFLHQRSAQEGAQKPGRFYICPVCFAVSLEPGVCHKHTMMPCDAENPEDCRPLVDETAGRAQTRAPRWFARAMRRVRTG